MSEVTSKGMCTRTKPWREINDAVSAKMMAASSDSPPLIPKRDYDEEFPRKTLTRQNQRIASSYNTTSECSSTDDCKNLINQANKVTCTAASSEERQIALYNQSRPPSQHPAPPLFYPLQTNQQPPLDPSFLVAQEFHPSMFQCAPGIAPMSIFPVPPQQPMGDECPFPTGYADAPKPMPPPFLAPSAFLAPTPFIIPPPPPMPYDFELFAYEAKRKKKKLPKRRHSRSLEYGFAHQLPPPPFFVPGPPLLAPPMLHPMPMQPTFQPLPFGRPSMLALETGPIDQPHMSSYAHTMVRGDVVEKPTPLAYQPETLKNGLKLKGDFIDGDDFYATQSTDKCKNDFDWTACCKGFSQILWIILTIILVGLILGLVLGLTLV